jgi:peptide/nickel transport system permease protein
MAVKGILNLDFPVIMGITLFGAMAYVVINLLVDVTQSWLDPRTRLA